MQTPSNCLAPLTHPSPDSVPGHRNCEREPRPYRSDLSSSQQSERQLVHRWPRVSEASEDRRDDARRWTHR